jgi:predicted enzyme related to lactoylglutathione lyase
VFAGVPTAEFEPAVGWYERLFGRSPDRYPRDGEAVWQLSDTGLIYVVTDPERAGNGLLTLIVDELDVVVDELDGRGIDVGPIDTIPGLVRRVTILDPDENRVTLGEVPAGAS